MASSILAIRVSNRVGHLQRHSSSPCIYQIRLKRQHSAPVMLRDKPYILSRLVIDLDAADSEAVQKAKDQDNEQVKSELRREKKPTYFEDYSHLSAPGPVFSSPFSTSITPTQLVRYALLDAQDSRGHIPQTLNEAFRHAHVQVKDSTDVKILKFTHNLTRSRKYSLNTTTATQYLRLALQECEETKHLYHLFALLSPTVQGCEALALNDANIIKAWKRLVHSDESNSRSCTKGSVVRNYTILFHECSNLCQSMLSKDVLPGPLLCAQQLRLAIERYFLPVARMYMKIIQENYVRSSINNLHDALSDLARHLFIGSHVLSREIFCDGEKSFTETFSEALGEGYELITARNHNNKQAYSFASIASTLTQATTLSHADAMFYANYICVLGQLKLIETLRFEWNLICSSGNYSRFTVTLFAISFLLGHEPSHAISVLSLLQEEKNLKADFLSAENLQLAENLTSVFVMAYSNLTVWTCDTLRRTLHDTLRRSLYLPPQDLLEALRSFVPSEDLLASVAESKTSNPSRRPLHNIRMYGSLQWSEVDGEHKLKYSITAPRRENQTPEVAQSRDLRQRECFQDIVAGIRNAL